MLADQDYRQARAPGPCFAESRNFARDPLAKRLCGRLSVDQPRRHPPQ